MNRLYCSSYNIFIQEESHESKLGEQQKILGEWWKHEEEDTHTKYERMVSQKQIHVVYKHQSFLVSFNLIIFLFFRL